MLKRVHYTNEYTSTMGDIFFYGHHKNKLFGCFSNFSEDSFDYNGQEYQWAEQAIMYGKATIMGDHGVAARIMIAQTPLECKRLGRQVGKKQGKWDLPLWASKVGNLIYGILRAKFSQNENCKKCLLATSDRFIAEASPGDGVWGIGISVKDAEAGKPWKEFKPGHGNLLGKTLTKIRTLLRDQDDDDYDSDSDSSDDE